LIYKKAEGRWIKTDHDKLEYVSSWNNGQNTPPSWEIINKHLNAHKY